MDEHVVHCCDALHRHLTDQPQEDFESDLESAFFVTWKHKGSLRGCQGNLSPLPLRSSLGPMAITAAVNDRRFKRVKLEELSELHCTVSLLHSFESVLDPLDDWHVGVHGLLVDIRIGEGRMERSTFLPQVATEQGWTRVETLDALMSKAGLGNKTYRQIVQEYGLEAVAVKRYQANVVNGSFKEFLLFNFEY